MNLSGQTGLEKASYRKQLICVVILSYKSFFFFLLVHPMKGCTAKVDYTFFQMCNTMEFH